MFLFDTHTILGNTPFSLEEIMNSSLFIESYHGEKTLGCVQVPGNSTASGLFSFHGLLCLKRPFPPDPAEDPTATLLGRPLLSSIPSPKVICSQHAAARLLTCLHWQRIMRSEAAPRGQVPALLLTGGREDTPALQASVFSSLKWRQQSHL